MEILILDAHFSAFFMERFIFITPKIPRSPKTFLMEGFIFKTPKIPRSPKTIFFTWSGGGLDSIYLEM